MRYLSAFWLLLRWLLPAAVLAACHDQPAVSSSRPPASRAAPVGPNAGAGPLAAVPDPPATVARVPDTTQLVREQRAVAPGLVVTTTGMLVSDDPAAVPRRILTIRRRGQLIYADTTADFLYPPDTTDAGTQLYPLWVPTGPGRGELLVRVASPPDFDIVRRFQVTNQGVTRRDTLPAFDGPARNLDQDAAPEFGGYRQAGEEWTDEQGHRWAAYNPRLYYEVRPTGLVLDSALTRRKALAQYGVFRGYSYSDTPAVRLKRP